MAAAVLQVHRQSVLHLLKPCSGGNGAPVSAGLSQTTGFWFCRLTFQGEVEPEAELGVAREGGADQLVGVVRVRLQLGLSQQERPWQEKTTLFHCIAEVCYSSSMH